MSELNDLYQEMILDHHHHPHNFRVMDHPDREVRGHNPLCGDQLTLYLRLKNGAIDDIAFQGSGCAISRASTSVMTDAVKHKRPDEVDSLFQSFHGLVTGRSGDAPPDTEKLGKLAVFSGVSAFPTRVKCAILAWHTLRQALKDKKETVTTE